MRYHLSMDGKVRPCRAKGACPFGTAFSNNEGKAYTQLKKTQDELFEQALESKTPLSVEQTIERGDLVNKTVNKLLMGGFNTANLHSKDGVYTEERQKQHRAILDELHKKYEHIPNDRKVIFSAGLPGAGKTTILTTQLEDFDVDEYATVSSDDFKEALAANGMIPEVDGFMPMEVSTLAHAETSYLADKFLKEMSEKGKNIIYDFTCKDSSSTNRRIGILEDYGYSKKDMQFVFVDIPLETARERAVSRYAYGTNQAIVSGKKDGGRYLPMSVLDASKSRTGKYSSKNAEALLEVYEGGKDDGMPEPLIFDNSGDSRKDPEYKPEKIDFKSFSER